MLNLNHYILEINNKLDMLIERLEALESLSTSLKQQTTAELVQLHNPFNTHTQQMSSQMVSLTTSLSEHKRQTAEELDQIQSLLSNTQSSLTSLSQHNEQTSPALNQLQTSITATHSSLTAHTLEVDSKLDRLTTYLTEHKNQTASELHQLQTSLSTTHSSLGTVNTTLNTLTATTTQLSTDYQQIQIGLRDTECISTEEILQLHQNLQNNVTHQLETLENYIEQQAVFICGGTGGWRRVIYLDMTDSSTSCPSGWKLTGHSKRTCGRYTFGSQMCDSVIFPVSGGEYSRVCARIRGYQWGRTGAFFMYNTNYRPVTTINGAYVDGVVLTHGSPQQHIWTFAAGEAESNTFPSANCPCDTSGTVNIPSFVGDDFFCESAVNGAWDYRRHYTLHSNDPLWDGKDCLSSSSCCSLQNPPYAYKRLPSSTSDDIEARICLNRPWYQADIAIELIELYVK